MKLVAFFLASACVLAHAGELRLDELGFPFRNRNLEIVWKTTTNRVPAMMNIYKAVPANFSHSLVTNLLAMGGFNEPEKVKNALAPALKGKDAAFEEIPAHKTISLSPSRGMALFFNTSRIPLPRQPEHGLPSDGPALKLALETAKTLGIKTNDLARALDSDQFLVRRDKRERGGLLNGKYTKRDIARGVYLYRAIDGIPVYGNGNCGGLYVNFGNDAQIAEVDMSWRNLEVKKRCPTATRDEVARRLRDGKAVIQIEGADPARIKKITILDMIPHYRTFPGDEAQAAIFPLLMIEATADLGDKAVPVTLFCPIIKE